MSDSSNNNSDNDGSNRLNYEVYWDNEFERQNENKGKAEEAMLKNLIGRKIKVWSVFTTTTGGVRGKMTGTVGTLTLIDDEFICLDNNIFLARKFISRIETIN